MDTHSGRTTAMALPWLALGALGGLELLAFARLRSRPKTAPIDGTDHGPRASGRRVHEARNALASIEGAARVLHRHHERLAPDEREQLAAAIAREVARLHRLLDGEAGPGVVEEIEPELTEVPEARLT